MQKLRLILGAVGRREARGILIGPEGNPRATLWRGSSPANLILCHSPEPARNELARRHLGVWSFKTPPLEPGTQYDLAATVGDEWTQTGFETLPAKGESSELSIAAMSCYYDGYHTDASYLSTLERWGQGIDFKILLGDNLYLDVPGDDIRSVPYEHTVDRYVRYFYESGYADVLGRGSTFVTWDDHEYWNNYPQRVVWLSRTWGDSRDEYENAARDCLDAFQQPLCPRESDDHRSFAFDEAPCVSFFFADVRTQRQRYRADGSSRLLGPLGIESLENWASKLERPGVLVIGQPMGLAPGNWADYNSPDFTDHYSRIWAALAAAPYDVMILSGDVHFSRILRFDVNSPTGGEPRPVYEVVTSPACHIPGFLGQGSANVVAPGDFKSAGAAIQPRITVYYAGSACPNTFAILKFEAIGRRVRVGVRFLDTLKNREPYWEKLGIDSSEHRWRANRQMAPTEMFVLDKRGQDG